MLVLDQTITSRFALYHADCIDVMSQLPEASLHFGFWSPPFSSLYTFSSSDRDMGNCKGDEEFFRHHDHFVKQIKRVLMPGRLVAMHCMLMPSSKQKDGVIGLRDFRGDLIRAFEKEGFVFHSEITIKKDPVVQMTRTKALGLLHKQVKKDSSMSRQGIADYVVVMRKPGEKPAIIEDMDIPLNNYVVVMRKPGDNPEPITHTNESFPVSLWERYASPVWDDINPSDTLQYRSAREDEDERHVVPTQLEVVRRCIHLWTNRGDTVFDPFNGIGSSGVVALELGRRYVGTELKASYYKQSAANLLAAEKEPAQRSLFDAT